MVVKGLVWLSRVLFGFLGLVLLFKVRFGLDFKGLVWLSWVWFVNQPFLVCSVNC